MARKTKSKTAKTKEGKRNKGEKMEKGETYYCEVCGCEVVCVQPGSEAVVCCDEPMLLVCE